MDLIKVVTSPTFLPRDFSSTDCSVTSGPVFRVALILAVTELLLFWNFSMKILIIYLKMYLQKQY